MAGWRQGVDALTGAPAVAGYIGLDAAGQVATAVRPRQAGGVLLIILVRGSMAP
jgi:hypothetical protein